MQYNFKLTIPDFGLFVIDNVNKLQIEKAFLTSKSETVQGPCASSFRNIYDTIVLGFIEPLNVDPKSNRIDDLLPYLEQFSKSNIDRNGQFMMLSCTLQGFEVFRYYVMLSNYNISRQVGKQLTNCVLTFVGSKRFPRINSSIPTTLGEKPPLPLTNGRFQI